MKIAVVGGTGTLGKLAVQEIRRRGHEARPLSRHSADYPVDLTTGAGLESALAGCDAVIDASNATGKAADVLVDGSKRLLAAEQAAGVKHHVCISIVGCDLVPMGYYSVKTEQERVVERGTVPWSIVRATQFHEFIVDNLKLGARWGILPMLRVPVQPVAAAEAAAAAVDVALGKPLNGRLNVTGPEIVEARELARLWQRAAGRRRAVRLPIPLPGKLGRALRAGLLAEKHPDVRGSVTFSQWLQTGGLAR